MLTKARLIALSGSCFSLFSCSCWSKVARLFCWIEIMAEGGVVIGCHTIDIWNEQLQRGIDTKKLVVIDFTASWCGPCRFISPLFVEWARKWPDVIFLKVDVDELRSVATDWAIEAMPTFMFLKEGNIVDKVVGARKDELHQKIEKHIATI